MQGLSFKDLSVLLPIAHPFRVSRWKCLSYFIISYIENKSGLLLGFSASKHPLVYWTSSSVMLHPIRVKFRESQN